MAVATAANYYEQRKSRILCKYWIVGRCTRQPCRFLHHSPHHHHHHPSEPHKPQASTFVRTRPIQSNVAKTVITVPERNSKNDEIQPDAKTSNENHACTEWMSGNCTHTENCRFPHSWVDTKAKKDIEKITELKKHSKTVTGIVLPSGSNILYTGSKDGTLRATDANTGKCIDSINVGAEVGCIVSEQSWVFVGVPNAIWAWNIQTSQRLSLEGPVGQVHAMLVNDDTLFAACEDGTILAYKPCPEKMTFRLISKLKGHNKAVLSFSCSITQLYSGSEDCTIRCWDIHTFECTHVLKRHSGAVTCLVTWECFLFSGSIDKTIKVWAGTKDQGIEEIYTCNEEQGVTSFMGMTDAAEKSVLFASTSDNSVRMYELGTEKCLLNRGRLFTRKRVTTIAFSGRQVFTGDTSGSVHVWSWLGEPITASFLSFISSSW